MSEFIQSFLSGLVRALSESLTARKLCLVSLAFVLFRLLYGLYSTYWACPSFNLDIPTPVLEWINFFFWVGLIVLLILAFCKVFFWVEKFLQKRAQEKKRLKIEQDLDLIISDEKLRKWCEVLLPFQDKGVVALNFYDPYVRDLVGKGILLESPPVLDPLSAKAISRYSLSDVAFRFLSKQIIDANLSSFQTPLKDDKA